MTKKTIIICDDNDPLAAVMKQVLVKHGYEVMTAGDGREGLDLVRAAKPDLLLLDLEMPALDGLGVLASLKELAGKRPYVIVVSAQEGEDKRRRARDLGAAEVWTKPFNAADLVRRVGDLVGQGLV